MYIFLSIFQRDAFRSQIYCCVSSSDKFRLNIHWPYRKTNTNEIVRTFNFVEWKRHLYVYGPRFVIIKLKFHILILSIYLCNIR